MVPNKYRSRPRNSGEEKQKRQREREKSWDRLSAANIAESVTESECRDCNRFSGNLFVKFEGKQKNNWQWQSNWAKNLMSLRLCIFVDLFGMFV